MSSGAPVVPEPFVPRKLGRYTLFAQIGKGGMAEIFLARAELELGATRLVVVKQILPAYADDPRFSEMLIHEAKLAAPLSHKNIVQVFDLGRAGGESDPLYIAMEYVEGFDLNGLLRLCTERQIGFPVGHALGVVLDVLDGLDYAHRRTDDAGRPLGIVHRDVSPSNVLISFDGEVKVCDFGIAHANELVREQDTEALRGKAGYMSPEHARGERVDARSDVFAAGILLWELLAGRRLYRPKSELSLLEQAQRAEIPAVPDKGLASHDELAKIVAKALAADPVARYASAAAFARDLEAYVARAGLLSSRLELGKWLTESFGTAVLDARRASERLLPKTEPPPRRPSAGAMLAAPQILSPSIPAARASSEPGSLAGASIDLDSERDLARQVTPEPPRALELPPAPSPAPPPPEDSSSPPSSPSAPRTGSPRWVLALWLVLVVVGLLVARMLAS